MKVKTFGESVKKVKNLFSILGIEYWHISIIELGRYYDWPSSYHSENSKIEPQPGDYYKIKTALIVSDPIELFIEKESFLFSIA